MAIINSTGFSHVRLTVTDIGRSKAFYDRVFGWPAVIDRSDLGTRASSGASGGVPIEPGPDNFYGGVLYATPQGTMLGLRPVGSDPFDPDRTGVDHVSFAVESRNDLERIAAEFDQLGIDHGEIRDLKSSGITILSFQDPDDINLELTAPLVAHSD